MTELEGGELPETECVVEAVCIGVVAGIVPSSIPLRNAARLTWLSVAFYSFEIGFVDLFCLVCLHRLNWGVFHRPPVL